MFKNIDIYLGVFLILSGFTISMVNLRRVLRRHNKFSSVLLSENILLVSIGVAFVIRAIYSMHPQSVQISDLNMNRMAQHTGEENYKTKCGFLPLLVSYGPLIVSMVNSFLSLVIDNYMHYQMMVDIEQNEENSVQHFEDSRQSYKLQSLFKYVNKNVNLLTIIMQWMVPLIIVMLMFPMQVKELSLNKAKQFDGTCMTMIEKNYNCFGEIYNSSTNYSTILPNPLKYYANQETKLNSSQFDSILENVLSVIKNYNNHSDFSYTNIDFSRRPKILDDCFKICVTDNKTMLLYMFAITLVSYFVPIIISTSILVRISGMKVNKPQLKTHVTRELLYNVLFWSPVMFDTFLSLILCSFSMDSMKTSLFNVIANVYQAVKNFMNTKYFKENTVTPV